MGLAEETSAEAATHHPGLPCSVKTALARLGPDDASEFEELMRNPSTSYAALSRALARRGIRVPSQQIGKHARDECRCGNR